MAVYKSALDSLAERSMVAQLGVLGLLSRGRASGYGRVQMNPIPGREYIAQAALMPGLALYGAVGVGVAAPLSDDTAAAVDAAFEKAQRQLKAWRLKHAEAHRLRGVEAEITQAKDPLARGVLTADAQLERRIRDNPAEVLTAMAQAVEETHQRAIAGVPDREQGFTQYRSLRKAQTGLARLAQLFASTAEPSSEAEPNAAHELPRSGWEAGAISLTEADKWLASVPFDQLAVLADVLDRARNGNPAIKGVDRRVAQEAWQVLQQVNDHVVGGAAEVIKADPNGSITAIRRLQERPSSAHRAYSTGTYGELVDNALARIQSPIQERVKIGVEGERTMTVTARQVPAHIGSPLLPVKQAGVAPKPRARGNARTRTGRL